MTRIRTSLAALQIKNIMNTNENTLAKSSRRLGSCQMRMEYGCANTTMQAENVQSAESVIRDANMAKEMTLYTRNRFYCKHRSR